MKPSISKSLQIMWSYFADSPVYRRIIEQSRPISLEIFMKRKEIENNFSELLKKSKSNFEIDDIKEIIYNEENNDDLMKIISIFDTGQELIELNNIIEIINDTWNYFPHKCLNGLCPMEKILENKQKKSN